MAATVGFEPRGSKKEGGGRGCRPQYPVPSNRLPFPSFLACFRTTLCLEDRDEGAKKEGCPSPPEIKDLLQHQEGSSSTRREVVDG